MKQEYFNELFTNIGKNIAKNIIKCSEPIINIKIGNSIYLTEVTDSEVYKIILKLSKASGIDIINASLLKLIIDFVTVPITYILNLCIKKGYWPTHLKKAEIIPIFKDGDKHEMTN